MDQWWFRPAPSERLSLLRIATSAYALWYLGNRIPLFSAVGRTDHSLYDPVSIITWLDGPIAPTLFDAIVWATLGLNLCALLGIAFRLTGPLFAIAVYVTLCYRNSWSMVYHSHNVFLFHLLILGFSRAADTLSIDALWQRRRGNKQPIQAAPQYGWPIQLMCVVTVITYCLAGIAKLATPAGFAWAQGAALRDQVGVDALRKEVLGADPGLFAPFIFDHIWLFTVMGVATLIAEAGAPFFLVNRRLSQLWCLATIGMHWGIFFIMGIRFRYQMSGIMFLSFFDIEKLLGKRFRPQIAPPQSTKDLPPQPADHNQIPPNRAS